MTKSNLSIYSRRLYEVRMSLGWSQEKLGVLLGLDEGVASVRISRYESGIHQPPFKTAQKIAKLLGYPLPYFFCEDEELANIIKNHKKNK
jgi:transcriptional regulator with XRE-family HTH domain